MFGRKLSAVLAGIGATALLAGCETKKNTFAPPPPSTVEVARPILKPVEDYLEFTGATRALARVDLRARVSGYLKSIHFEDGATVRKDDLLFVIDQAPYKAKVEVAKAELSKAEANHRLAESELARSRFLLQRNAGTPQELDIKIAERDSAQSNVESAGASLHDAELQLGYTEIRAPITGRIGRHLVDVGNLVQPEQTLLATIEAYDPIHVYFTTSESNFLKLNRRRQEDKRPDQEKEGLDLEMGLGDDRGYPHRGKLDFAELGVDPETGTSMHRAVFPNADRMLVPGLFTRLRAAVGAPKPSLLVPAQAVGVDQRGDYVLVVRPDDTVEYRQVELGPAVGTRRVVADGLKQDDWVVINGIQFARPGAKVAPRRVEQVASGDSDSLPLTRQPRPLPPRNREPAELPATAHAVPPTRKS